MRFQRLGIVPRSFTLSGLTSLALGGILALGGATPSFAAVTQVQAPGATDAKTQAQALFTEGVTLYKMSDYQAALEQFKKAFKLSMKIEDDEMRARVLHALQFNLARAHVKTYEIDRDMQHLRVAVDLLNKYSSSSDEFGADEGAEQLLAYAQAELTRATPAPSPVVRSENDTSQSGAEVDSDESVKSGEQKPLDNANRRSNPSGKALRIGGYVALGLGAASLGLVGGGMAMGAKAKRDYADAGTASDYDSAISRGNTGNALALTGAVAAGVLLSAGVVLLVVEKKKGSRATQAARLRFAPQMGSDGGGVWLGGVF
jgi:tetratricopeptide (TPR) repeat protein